MHLVRQRVQKQPVSLFHCTAGGEIFARPIDNVAVETDNGRFVTVTSPGGVPTFTANDHSDTGQNSVNKHFIDDYLTETGDFLWPLGVESEIISPVVVTLVTLRSVTVIRLFL